MAKKWCTPQRSEPNVRGLYQTAQRLSMPMTKLLNLIVAVSLEALRELDADDIEIITLARQEEPA